MRRKAAARRGPWACLAALVEVLTCGFIQLGLRQQPEAAAPLLVQPSPHRRGRHGRGTDPRRHGSGRETAPDTTHVLDQGHRDITRDYVLEGMLGQGAFGVVRLAVHARTGLRYAVKTVYKSQLRRRADLEDLRREALILAQLSSHPSVAALLQTYEDEAAVHIVMELCEGGELFERIAARGSLTEREAAHFFRQMVEVVRHAHALGIMHRDIKPENFMLADSTDDARIKACDFGLSQFFRPGRNFHSLVGSAFYVAPEVLRRDYGPAADVWSLGVCLYTLLSGLLPFFGETEEEVFDMVLHADLDLETAPWPSVSRHAKDLVKQMLQRDPSRRPTPDALLQHPWLCEAAPDRPLEQVVGRLAQLHAKNKVARAAMVVAATRLGHEEVPGLYAIFRHLDVDRSGHLSVDELRVGLQRQGKTVSEEEALRLIQAADVDGDGQISLAEFVAATLGRSMSRREDFLRALFRTFDANGDSRITPAEMIALLGGLGVSAEDIAAVLEAHDLDHNGVLDWPEFLSLMGKQTGSIQEAVRRRLPSQEQSSGVSLDEGEEEGERDE